MSDDQEKLFTARPPAGGEAGDVYSASTVAVQTPADLLDLVRSAEETARLAATQPSSKNKFRGGVVESPANPGVVPASAPVIDVSAEATDDGASVDEVPIELATAPPPAFPPESPTRKAMHAPALPPRRAQPPAPLAGTPTGPPPPAPGEVVVAPPEPSPITPRSAGTEDSVVPRLDSVPPPPAHADVPVVQAEVGRVPPAAVERPPRRTIPPVIGIILMLALAIAALAVITR